MIKNLITDDVTKLRLNFESTCIDKRGFFCQDLGPAILKFWQIYTGYNPIKQWASNKKCLI